MNLINRYLINSPMLPDLKKNADGSFTRYIHRFLAGLLLTACTISPATAQLNEGIPSSVTTPDKVETRIGTLHFNDGQPTQETLQKVYDNIDFTNAIRSFSDTLQGVSILAIRKGIASVGAKDNEVIVFSELMDAKSLFLTANADTIYIIGSLDLSKGPMVIEVPRSFLVLLR